MLVLVGQIQHHEALSRDVEDMNPDEGVAHPACRWVLHARAFLVRTGGLLRRQDRADAVCESRIDEPTPRHAHPEGQDALRFFEREGGRQTLRSVQEAHPACGLGLPCGAGESGRGGSLALVACVRREAQTAVLVKTRLAVRAPRRAGSGPMGDALVGLGARAWAPPLPIMGRGGEGTVSETRGLPGVGKTRQGLSGVRFPGQGRAAPRLAGFACVGTRLAPLRVDSARGLRLARRGIEEDPAWRDAPLARWHHVRARARRERRHGLRSGLGQDRLRGVQGRWPAGDPLEAGLGQLVPILGALERAVGHERGGIGSGVERCHGGPEDLADRCAIMTLATPGLPQPRRTGLVLPHQLHHHVVAVRALGPTRALGAGPDLCVRRLRAVRAAIAMQTRRSALAAPTRQPQTGGRRSGHEAGECRPPKVIEGIKGAPERVIIAMARRHAWGHEACERLSLEKMGDEVERLVEKAQTIEHPGGDRRPSGHHPHFRVWRGGAIQDFRDAECFKHPRDQAQVISDLGTVRLWLWREVRAVRVSQSLLLCRGIVSAPKNYSMTCEWCGIADKKQTTCISGCHWAQVGRV